MDFRVDYVLLIIIDNKKFEDYMQVDMTKCNYQFAIKINSELNVPILQPRIEVSYKLEVIKALKLRRLS